jgi:uncharacterized phiE125 gp8 family phage protein
MLTIRCTTPATVEPVTLDEAKAHCRVDGTHDDALLSALIKGARMQAEAYTRRVLCPSTWTVDADFGLAVGDVFVVPVAPCSAVVSVSVDGALVDPSLYTFARSALAPNETPMLATITALGGFPAGSALTVVVSAGWEQCPADLKSWLRVRIGTLYEQREAFTIGPNSRDMPRTFVDCLLDPYVIPGGM